MPQEVRQTLDEIEENISVRCLTTMEGTPTAAATLRTVAATAKADYVLLWLKPVGIT